MEVVGQRWELELCGAMSWGGVHRELYVPVGERVGSLDKA